MISIVILNCYKARGYGVQFFLVPISKVSKELAAILFVDNNDLLYLNMNGEETL